MDLEKVESRIRAPARVHHARVLVVRAVSLATVISEGIGEGVLAPRSDGDERLGVALPDRGGLETEEAQDLLHRVVVPRPAGARALQLRRRVVALRCVRREL